jgi:hypothetical protein
MSLDVYTILLAEEWAVKYPTIFGQYDSDLNFSPPNLLMRALERHKLKF